MREYENLNIQLNNVQRITALETTSKSFFDKDWPELKNDVKLVKRIAIASLVISGVTLIFGQEIAARVISFIAGLL